MKKKHVIQCWFVEQLQFNQKKLKIKDRFGATNLRFLKKVDVYERKKLKI